MNRLRLASALLLLLAASPALAQEKAPTAAIFDFGMKAGTDDWQWLEKGLADMLTTHFIRSGIAVVARDEMEQLAIKMNWVPEMGERKKDLDEVKNQLKISFLVTGTYAVKNDQVTITAQVVNVASRKEVLRKEISGPAADVLDLQTKLARQIVPFFSGNVKAEDLPELTPWTRSIPAAKALYAGIHLYDQGRYGEAWVYFRRAASTDPEYHDAAYWVARMYYFMGRFEHARIAYEQFIYEDTSHPRAGDAVKEYLHSFESLNPSAKTLLDLYARLSAAYPGVSIDMGKFQKPLSNRRWLELREAQLRGQLGQHKLAMQLTAVRRPGENPGQDARIAGNNANLHNLLTGEVILPKSVREEEGADSFVQFAPDKLEVNVRGSGELGYYMLAAPSGYTFKSIRAYLVATGTTERIGMHLHKDVWGDVPTPSFSRSFDRARDEGFLFNNVPRCGFILAHYWLLHPPGGKDPGADVQGLRFVVELEKLGPHGALEVLCDTTGDFRVDVDGRMGRWGSGLIGLLSPGEHTLRFYSAGKQVIGKPPLRRTPFGEWTTKVTVEAGHVTRVVGHLPWAQDTAWTGWDNGTLIAKNYPGFFLGDHASRSMPSIQMDNDTIRIVWSYLGDLWWTESRDGETYSAPAKLPLPISTAWAEDYPRLLRDESGRFVLLFASDRNASHEHRAYISWSRDFQHWSAPAIVADRPIDNLDIMQDDLGRFLYVDTYDKKLTISASHDLYRWETLTTMEFPELAGPAKITQRPDGSYDLTSVKLVRVKNAGQWNNSTADNVGVFHSNDAREWSPRKELGQLESQRRLAIAVLQPPGRQIMAYFSDANRAESLYLQFQERKGQSYGPLSKGIGGVASYDAALAWHRKWGYVMTWSTPRSFGWGNTLEGPFVMRGQSLDTVMPSGDLPRPVPPQ